MIGNQYSKLIIKILETKSGKNQNQQLISQEIQVLVVGGQQCLVRMQYMPEVSLSAVELHQLLWLQGQISKWQIVAIPAYENHVWISECGAILSLSHFLFIRVTASFQLLSSISCYMFQNLFKQILYRLYLLR